MGLESGEQSIDAAQEALVDDALVLQSSDVVLALQALLVDLVLLGANEGALVDVGVNLDVRVIGELESILGHVSEAVEEARSWSKHLPTCCSRQAYLLCKSKSQQSRGPGCAT